MPEINQDIALDDIIIDEELKYLLPQLSEETFAALEANILEHGLRDALVLWEGEEGSILIDGHNRYEVIKKHDLPFSVVYMNFSSKDEVIVWMIKTQIARRNLTQMQHTLFRGMHYEAEKRIQGTQNQYVQKANSETESEKGHSDPFHSSTASRLGEKYKVSPRTIKRDAQAAAGIIAIGEVSSPAKIKVLEESTDITRKQLRDLATAKPDLIAEVATAIEAGTFERGSLTTALTPPSEENTDSSGSDSGSADTAGTGQPPSAQVLATAARTLATELLAKLPAGSTITPAQLQAALRTHADNVEALIRQIGDE